MLAGGGEGAAVRAEGERADEAAQRAQAGSPAQGARVEEVHHPVAVPDGERAAVRADRDAARQGVAFVGHERAVERKGPDEAAVAGQVPDQRALGPLRRCMRYVRRV